MKVIFLDIDGVMNHQKYYKECMEKRFAGQIIDYPFSEFSPESVRCLNKIINKTNAKIVITSSWRFDGLKEINYILKDVGVIDDVYDITPDLYSKYQHELCRGKEIDEWLAAHPDVEKYVIIDDDVDMEEHQFPYFVNTDPYKDGLNDYLADVAIEILNS